MRVVSGTWRGTQLASPKGDRVRPTTDRVKEAMFGSLNFVLPGAEVLDAFGGSGALGIEAASRGAARVIITEPDENALRCIRENVGKIGHPEQIELMRGTLEKCLPTLAARGCKFSVVLLDPPYAKDLYEESVRLLLDHQVLSPDAILVMESDRPVDIELPEIVTEKTKKYGSIYVAFARFRPEDENEDGDPVEEAQH